MKSTSDKERIKLWHNHFKYILDNNNQSIIHSENSTNILNKLEFITGPFTKEEVINATKIYHTEKKLD